MREYKKLQRLADEYLEQYNNTEFLEEMKGEIRKNAEQANRGEGKKRNLLWTFFASAASVLLIAVSLFVFLPQKNVPIEEKHYTLDNLEFDNVDLITLNNGLTKIQFDNKQYEEIKQYYDTFYNDILYYETEYVASDIENILIVVITNLNYEYEFKFDFDKMGTVYGYTLDYVEQFTDMGGVYECQVCGQFDTGVEKLYFTYNAYTVEQSSNFVNLIKEIIKQK